MSSGSTREKSSPILSTCYWNHPTSPEQHVPARGHDKIFLTAITKSLTWKAKGNVVSVRPQNCSGPEIRTESPGLFFSHWSLYPSSSGNHLHSCWKTYKKKIIKALWNDYKRLQESKNTQRWQCAQQQLLSPCLRLQTDNFTCQL